jgi:hypothetical protein
MADLGLPYERLRNYGGVIATMLLTLGGAGVIAFVGGALQLDEPEKSARHQPRLLPRRAGVSKADNVG